MPTPDKNSIMHNLQALSGYFASWKFSLKMHKNILPKIKKLLADLVEWFRLHVIRPIEKSRRRRAYLKHQALKQEAVGELIEKFEPFLMQVLDQSLSDYHEAMPQNFYTIQARHDIRRIYEIKLKSLITSQK